MPTSTYIGKSEIANYPLQYIPGFTLEWKTMVADDGAVDTASVLLGSASRFGVGNTAVFDVISTGDGTTVDLYVKQGTDYIFVSSQTTTAAKQQLTFTGLTGRDHYVKVTNTPGATTINAGITQ